MEPGRSVRIAEESHAVRREKLAGGLDGGEEDPFAATRSGHLSRGPFQSFERSAERLRRLAQRLDPDR